MTTPVTLPTTIAPPRVRPHDLIAVCAPAGPVPADKLRAGVARLERRYRVRLAPSVLGKTGFLSADDAVRAAELEGALRDPEVSAVMMGAGGYGTMRMVERLDARALGARPRLLVGFSDITVLLAWAVGSAGVRCIHGPTVAQLADLPEPDLEWLFRLMEEPAPMGDIGLTLAPIGARTDAPRIEGTLFGGNLCLLAHLMGTRFAPAMEDVVLALEEWGERPYSVDRLLTHLGLAGLLERTVAALVGELTDCVETLREGHPDAMAVVHERLRCYGVPGLAGLPLAHGTRHLALPLGVRCAVHPAEGRVELLQAAVA